MFTSNSRYAKTPTVTTTDGEGREVTAVRLRKLPEPGGDDVTVAAADQLDVIAEQCYRDPTRFWHIADANAELDARDLLIPVGRPLRVPER